MKEQVAGLLERAVVHILLRLERYIEQKPEPQDLQRWSFTRLRWASLGIVLMGSSLIILLNILDRRAIKTDQLTKIPPVAEAQVPEDSQISWQTNPEVISKLAKARENEDLVILGSESYLYTTDLFFINFSKEAILSVDQVAMRSWLAQQDTLNQRIAFIFSYLADQKSQVTGATINIRMPLDHRFSQQVTGQTTEQLYNNFSLDLSASVAMAIKYTQKYGAERTAQLLSSQANTPEAYEVGQTYAQYKSQFAIGQFKPLIRIIALNPLWIQQKHPIP